MSTFRCRALLLGLLLPVLAACGSSSAPTVTGSSEVATADCGPGSQPETGLQGEVPLADRQSGRNLQGYSCNMKLVGQYQGPGASVVSPSYDHCAYMSTSGALLDPLQLVESSPGVVVVDASDPAQPLASANLTGPSMLIGTWESLKVSEPRKLLGGVAVGGLTGAGFFDVYDVSDCAHPVQTNAIAGTSLELPDNVLGHEGNWSPDGKTYWATGTIAGSITAIDVSDPSAPKIVYTGLEGFPANHGVEFSADGNTMYLATCFPGGVTILDVSDIQSRKAVPMIRQIGSLTWNPFSCGQHALPVTWNGKPYLIAPDEFDSEGIHIIDIADPSDPKIVKQIQLQIQLKENAALRTADTAGDGLFGYESHYCTVDRSTDPRALACGYFQSGIRVFNIVDPQKPREIAYYNPPAQTGKGLSLQHSLHAWIGGLLPPISDLYTSDSGASVGTVSIDARYVGNFVASLPSLLAAAGSGPVSGNLSADWCSSPPRFVGDQLWVTCMDNGFMVLQFTNGAYPIQ
ncbi:LVIVD repeat-containing protein [Solimonas terrae]|uniref:Choice-of-anchor B family protein n=1 Tax=Solimonas terrae TaxID=1396819 RepID=A0A6M2BSR7_9GAMM|nr:hypothetical protein [Solimonas terrae]NGY05059.1 hypothetical protein [Solimonas terrae]